MTAVGATGNGATAVGGTLVEQKIFNYNPSLALNLPSLCDDPCSNGLEYEKRY